MIESSRLSKNCLKTFLKNAAEWFIFIKNKTISKVIINDGEQHFNLSAEFWGMMGPVLTRCFLVCKLKMLKIIMRGNCMLMYAKVPGG